MRPTQASTRTESAEALRQTALGLVSSHAWLDVCTLLAQQEAAVMCQPTLTSLLGEAYLRTGSPRDARTWLERMLPEIERGGDRVALRHAVNLLGAALFELGELLDAQAAFERALDLGREDGDDLLVARATNNLGAIANVRGEREQALSMYALAVAAYQQLGDARGLAGTHHNLGITFRHLGQLDRADEWERRAIEFAQEVGDARLLLFARLGRAEISLAQGDARLAEAAAAHVAHEFERLGDTMQQAGALRLVAEAILAQGRGGAARLILDAALSLARRHGSLLDEAEILRTRAAQRATVGNHRGARRDAAMAIAIFHRLDLHQDCDALALRLVSLGTTDGDPSVGLS
jgi:tetratricopeptide (TPR) repeat protein